jgi:transcription-repair coupling factor (superfamily II helicase)
MILRELSESFARSGEFDEFIRRDAAEKIHIEGIAPSSYAFAVASIFNRDPRQTLVVVKNYQRMLDFHLDLSCFVEPDSLSLLPSWEMLPYEFVSPSENIERERVAALYRLLDGGKSITITPLESVLRALPVKEFFLSRGFRLDRGDEYPFDDLLELFVSYGYTREYRVEAAGQFSVKGGIIDIFIPSLDNPVRLDFFGDALDSIREFDVESPRSLAGLDAVTVYPRREIVPGAGDRKKLLEKIREAAEKGLEVPHVEGEGDDTGLAIPGVEDLFPLAIEHDYLPSFLLADARVILIDTGELMAQRDMLEKTFAELYKKRSKGALAVAPDLLLKGDILDGLRASSMEISVMTHSLGAVNWKLRGIPNFQGRIKTVRAEIERKLREGWRVVVCTGFEGQARRLADMLNEFNPAAGFEEFTPGKPVNILITSLREGFEIALEKVMILTDHEIFGKTYRKKSQFKKKTSRALESVLDLKEGDFVVHINHGIGIFRGIERMAAGGVERDFVLIEYSEGDKLYVSLDQITMLQRYMGLEGKAPRIDSLGEKSAWNRIREKVQKSVEELAKDLIRIYAQRRAVKGYQFPPDTLWQEEFESKFEYEETPDQITSIEDVKDDMETPRPMDRLICGDVGFGKTEVAIRAAFKCVMAGRQAAVLVPTTILAMQHFSTFTKRFSDYPVSIDMISRFRTRPEMAAVKAKLAVGSLDIVIGTHALLAKDVSFKNLGILIIDEEQRFGVKHKEQIKKIRTLVDVLTLSATPIPRTLHMSLAGIKDISIIQTPPENRQAIETYVLEDNPDIMRAAILRELERGGQVFYVHNRVENIDIQARMIRELVPEASFCVAHGQMREFELEDVMLDFLDRKYDVLVSTTIIESGLDMPNVNTIIVNRSDTFGLSQLYQLKGRVGRSVTKAYAYLFYPMNIPLTETAQKRLQVIAEYSELGSGFKIAMKDLEIRGSGNILGREQSGDIMDVGFDLYIQMLEDAVRALKGEKPLRVFRTPVFMKTDFFIPESYIADERQKMEIYKRFESCDSLAEVEELEAEVADRFGVMPREVRVLVEIEKIRTLASNLEIDEIIEDRKAVRIRISSGARVNRERMVPLMKKDKRLLVDRGDKEVLVFTPGDIEDEKKLLELKKLLQQLI